MVDLKIGWKVALKFLSIKPILSGIGNSIKVTIRIKHLRKNLKMKTAATNRRKGI